MNRGKLLVVSGPSAGVGKDTLLKLFLDKHPDWYQPPSATTRPAREGEIADKDMIFVSSEQFKEWTQAGKFLETDFHADNWYGTLRQPVEELLNSGKNVILRIDVHGALNVKQLLPEARLIFITAENFEALEDRLRTRHSENEEQIERRLTLAKEELKYADKYDRTIVNYTDHSEQAIKDLENYIGTLDQSQDY